MFRDRLTFDLTLHRQQQPHPLRLLLEEVISLQALIITRDHHKHHQLQGRSILQVYNLMKF